MNFKKLQAMQLELDNSILSAKPQMTAEERFNKTLVALSVEVSEVANCAEHFKFWKDNKGKIDRDKYQNWAEVGTNKEWYEYYDEDGSTIKISAEQAHKLTLVEETSDCLHFILSLANQIGYVIDGHYNELEETETIESVFLNLVFQITLLQRYDVVYSKADEVTLQCVINNYFQYIEKLGITTQELEQAYYEKNEENYRRLREGY
ncbi:dUTP diphosphatase [Vagococcus fluvialis]|uniref:dUTP diphosphatase n=1 Tax=Vagococcus fluvialis TaxID=2738 RepID=UPI0032E49474